MTNITERTRVEESKPAADAQPRELRSFLSTFIAWTAIAAGLVAAALLVLLTMTSDPAPQPREVHHPAPESSLLGTPHSADAAERWLAHSTLARPVGVPGSADAAERYLADSK
jgi:hypothetical protein